MKTPITKCRAALVAATLALASFTATSADTYTETRYPVVLVHGFFGFNNIGAIDYFYGIPQALRDGGSTVFIPSVSAANSNEVRGEQLLQTLRNLKATYGYTKFNLVGHSQGGHTVRYVAAVAPELIASVTTVGTPHTGSNVADALLAVSSVPVIGQAVIGLVNGIATVISYVSGSPENPQDASAAVASLNSTGAAEFNRKYPQGQPTTYCGTGPSAVNGVNYYSAGGTSLVTNPLDISDPILLLGSLTYGLEPNDGLAGQCSTHWGTVLKDNYPWNHLDEINQVFGLYGVFAPDPVAFYRSQVNRLKNAGL